MSLFCCSAVTNPNFNSLLYLPFTSILVHFRACCNKKAEGHARQRPKDRRVKAQGQPRKGTRAGKIMHTGRHEKPEGQARKGTRAEKKRHKGRQEMAHGQASKGTKASKKMHKDRQVKAQGQEKKGTRVGKKRH